jgi:putative spermidine/putrescine transport system substrate-binding protein
MKTVKHAVLALLAVSAMGGSTLAQEMKKEVGKGERQVNIVAWPGYIERGTTDKAYDWVTDFEKATSCKVNVKTAGTSDEMVALMNEGGFDLVTASGDASLRLIAGKRVQPINIDLIPSWKTVDERLQNAPWHTVDGIHYGVPYQWGANVLAYNTNVFKEPPKSWAVVFEEQNLPDGKSNKGRVQAFDGPIYIADAALFLMAKKPELGIKDPYELNEEQYKAALDLLRAQRALVGRYWHDAFMQIDDFKNEGVVASSSWPFQVNLLQADKDAMAKTPVASVIPDEGATGWADTTMMHVDAANPNCAYLWMEHSISPKVQGDLAAWFGSVPAVPAACKGNALLTDAGCDTNGMQNFDNVHFWRTPVAQCKTQPAGCVPYYRWATDMIAVLGGR